MSSRRKHSKWKRKVSVFLSVVTYGVENRGLSLLSLTGLKLTFSCIIENTTHRQFQSDMPTFDFQRFLRQMKEPSAAPIARYTMG